MASARIPYNNGSTPLGALIRQTVANIVEGRKNAAELQRVLDKYVDDTAGIAADSGVSAGNVPLLKNLVAGAAAEMGAVTLATLNIGGQTNARQLADAMG